MKIIDNSFIVINTLTFDPSRYFYLLQVCSRFKDGLDNNECLFYKIIKNKDQLQKFIDIYKPICEKCNLRMYINIEPICFHKYADIMRHESEMLGDVELTDSIFSTVYNLTRDKSDQLIDGREKLCLLDIDTEILYMKPEIKKMLLDNKYPIKFIVPTTSGEHWITTMAGSDFLRKNKIPIGFHPECRLLLYSSITDEQAVINNNKINK